MRLAFILLMVTATPALAQASNPVSSSTASEAKAPREKLICQDQDALGTRLGGRRVCKTVAQWTEERQQTRAEIERRQSLGCVQGAGC